MLSRVSRPTDVIIAESVLSENEVIYPIWYIFLQFPRKGALPFRDFVEKCTIFYRARGKFNPFPSNHP
jgi:hypothetical protein